jgi:hypothetical protein
VDLEELNQRYPQATDWEQHDSWPGYYWALTPDGVIFVRVDADAGLLVDWTAPPGTELTYDLIIFVYRRLGRTLRPAQRTAAGIVR